jgi:hypothetical protein
VTSALLLHAFVCLSIAVYSRKSETVSTPLNIIKDYSKSLMYVLASLFSFNTPLYLSDFGIGYMLCDIIMLILSDVLIVVLLREGTSIAELTIFKDLNYFVSLEKMLKLLKVNKCSKRMATVIKHYLMFVYTHYDKKPLPVMVERAPRYLREPLMNSVYGSYLIKFSLFKDCNHDFMRQLVNHLKLQVYFTGNSIVRVGTVDSRLYIVHAGVVEKYVVYTKKGSVEEETVVLSYLRPGVVFGRKAGLHSDRPHKFSYRANTWVEILSLTFNDWRHLLEIFPDVKTKLFPKKHAK